MARLEFVELRFVPNKKAVRVFFKKHYFFDLQKTDLEKISTYEVEEHAIVFQASEKRALNKFRLLLDRGFAELKSIWGRKAFYITQGPLLGCQYFGIVDRNTNLIELRPNTGCNLNCIYCSVDEGTDSKKANDYLVNKDLMLDEFKEVLKNKDCRDIEAHINPQGEPLLYEDLIPLVKGLSSLVDRISMDTNGLLLTRVLIDELASAGLRQVNISINSCDVNIAHKMAKNSYNTTKVLEMAKYAKLRMSVILAPVLVPGINENDIDNLIGFAKRNTMKIYIQNYYSYRHGRNPAKEMNMKKFYGLLKSLEKKHKLRLIADKDDFNIVPTRNLDIPVHKGQILDAELVFRGRLKNEMIGRYENRLMHIRNCRKEKGSVRVKISRTKHNIIHGVPI